MHRFLARFSYASPSIRSALGDNIRALVSNVSKPYSLSNTKGFSGKSDGGENDNDDDWRISSYKDTSRSSGTSSDGFGWDSASSWSTGMTKDQFDGQALGHKVDSSAGTGMPNVPQSTRDEDDDMIKFWEDAKRQGEAHVKGWVDKMVETSVLLKQVQEPGARGSYLKDSEKAEMYKLHKQNPELYTVEKLAKDYRIMRQRVHAILWLKELEEEEEKRLGEPLDDFIEHVLDTYPDFFNSHDREFHVASLPYKPEFKVMPEGWDGTARDPDEVHYEISMKEDEMLYQDFVQRMNFNKKKMAGEIKCNKYSRRRTSNGWNITVEKLGPRGKRGNSGGWKFVSMPDGSSRPLNELEKMFVKRETVRRRRKILP